MDYAIFSLGDVQLQSGTILPNAFLAYKTYGQLNEAKDNVILFPTAFADTHKNNEWLIGTDKALNPEKYFIIVPNLFGNGLSSSPSNTPPPYDRGRFPQITIYDNVRFQHQLVTEQFGIEKIALVTGWSLAASQTFQWAASYPKMVERIAPFQGTAKTWPHTYVFFEGVQAPILADPTWNRGQYSSPLTNTMKAVGRVYAGWGFSQAFYREEVYQQLGFHTLDEMIKQFWEQNFRSIDANNFLAMLWTGQHGDISQNSLYNGNFDLALKSILAKAMIMPSTTDLYFTIEDSQFEAERIPHAEFLPIDSIWGHFAGRGINPVDNETINRHLKEFLSS